LAAQEAIADKTPLYGADFSAAIFSGDLFDRDFSLSGNHDGFPISKNAMRA